MTDVNNLPGNAPVPDAGLASANNSTFKVLAQGEGIVDDNTTATTYFYAGSNAQIQHWNVIASGSDMYLNAQSAKAFWFDPADHLVSGLTTKGRVRAVVATNGVAPGRVFTFALYPITTVAGGSAAIGLNADAAVSGSSFTISPTGTNAIAEAHAEFTIGSLSAGLYGIGFSFPTGPIASGSRLWIAGALDTRNT